MKRLYKRTAALLLAVALILPLTACYPGAPEGNVLGIRIEEDAPYSAETLAYAEQTLLSLMTDTYRKAVLNNISETVEKRLADYARRLCRITAATPIAEAQYLWAIDRLAAHGPRAMDELIAMRQGTSTDCQEARRLYLDLSSVFGADHVASMLYDACLLTYDVRYERTIEKLEQYQYPWYREEADALSAERAVFAEGIGREDFSALVRCGTAMVELASIEAAELPNAFSDTELLEILRHLDLSEIQIDAPAWKLLLTHALPAEGTSYRAKLCDAIKESGDVERLAERMNDTLTLLVTVMERLTPEDIALLRAGKRDELIASLFSHFDEGDWTLFGSVSAVALSNDVYSALAAEEYGEDYAEYLASIQPMSMEELRAAVGHPSFYLYVSDYLAGICPAIAYEVRV